METDTIQIPIKIVEIIKWVSIAGVASMTIVFIALLSALRDAAQQRFLSRDQIIKNERANILIGITLGEKKVKNEKLIIRPDDCVTYL